jgi:hypothetical protein
LPELTEDQIDEFAAAANMHNEANNIKQLKNFITSILKYNLDIVQKQIDGSAVNPKTGLTAL